MKKYFSVLIIILTINYFCIGCSDLTCKYEINNASFLEEKEGIDLNGSSYSIENENVSFNQVSCLEEEKIYNYEDVKDKIIRFHVLANSDSKEDQNLKLKIKDAVINYLYSYLKDCDRIEDARKIIKEQEETVKEIALEVIKDNGYDYPVNIQLSHENFPEKSYGNITLPQGNYEAFRILIGNAEGHNWWCVMFPSLCFIDVTKGQVAEDKSRDALDKVVGEGTSDERIVCKSKFLEFIKCIVK